MQFELSVSTSRPICTILFDVTATNGRLVELVVEAGYRHLDMRLGAYSPSATIDFRSAGGRGDRSVCRPTVCRREAGLVG